MPSEKNKRWHKDSPDARFIVRQIINKKISLENPSFDNFIRDFPSFSAYGTVEKLPSQLPQLCYSLEAVCPRQAR